jgi:hypothetical protein
MRKNEMFTKTLLCMHNNDSYFDEDWAKNI